MFQNNLSVRLIIYYLVHIIKNKISVIFYVHFILILMIHDFMMYMMFILIFYQALIKKFYC